MRCEVLGFHLLEVAESDFFVELGLANGEILCKMSEIKKKKYLYII